VACVNPPVHREVTVMSTELRPIQDVLHNWILAGQALVGMVGGLSFIAAFTSMRRTPTAPG
jgi:hypothetical protein